MITIETVSICLTIVAVVVLGVVIAIFKGGDDE